MKKLIIIIILFSFYGCDYDTAAYEDGTTTISQTVNFEGCEYVKFGIASNSWGAHKGNCKNPIHLSQSFNPSSKLE
jgi:hypothetical protein